MIVPTANGFMVGATAGLIEEGGTLKAWAERYVRADPNLKWILGNYVEADLANENGHIFPLEDLVRDQYTVAFKPLNMMHREHYIVGAFAGAQLLTPEGLALEADDVALFRASQTSEHAHVEALAGMWHDRFPEEYFNVRRAHKEGTLYYSMEARPSDVSCPTCDVTAAFAGFESDDYCEHMQGATGPKRLHNSTFCGGAIIIPPTQPGWKRANVKTISKLIEEAAVAPEAVYAAFELEVPHLDPAGWEAMMTAVLTQAGLGTKPPKKGKAMDDGSFPIANVADLQNAIRAVGRAKNPAAAKAHIKRMAKKLGREDLVPDAW